ncbi:LysM peptidoglycan-binding domain-containing protein [Streptomyces sp. RB6PN25]|uniref:LysM peptidoglycan-binding domain-containing protein n=1 Tax=Streptomyces humicola TaxID=2953240 RepID=A0ABT1PZP3_9ACTN|nr:LysM peptidoglycan-binding domain-containing protein [Streptomyces humicola]MCQ4082598.1 LysM peptidoglycan-binding domain-containing protein [Streptomyces humicola]
MPIAAFNRLTRTRLVSTGCAVAIGTFALTGVVSTGTAEAASPSTYTVQSGDNLTSIANAEHVAGGWQALASANNLTSPYIIQPGQVLNLPSGSPSGSTATATATPAVAKTSSSTATAQTASSTTYPNNLDGWIRQSLAIMAQNGIPGSYNGIYRNIMRESSGNPNAVNNWDSNAAAGTPSEGLLQVIQPTFNAYHVPGTSWNLVDPVANITAACNYAYHVYGSIDNVNGPY